MAQPPTLAGLYASLKDDLGVAGDTPKELVEAGLATLGLTFNPRTPGGESDVRVASCGTPEARERRA